MNLRNYSDNNPPTWDTTTGGKSNVNLVRQSSVYSLTFDEFQNTMGGIGKDFGSMNMDELLKNIWTAEETQGLAATTVSGSGEGYNGNNLQRQGSLTLPRTLSQKTVDEVWRDLIKESSSSNGGAKDSASSIPQTQRQPTLGEITLEEFLVRAGVVREDNNMPQQVVGSRTTSNNNNGWFGSSDFPRPNNNVLVGFQQQQPNRNNLGENNNNNLVVPNPKHPPPPPSQRHNNQPPPLFPKPANVAFAPPPPSMHLLNNALASPGRRGGMIGIQEHSMNNVGMVGLTGNVNASPVGKMSPDVITKSNVDSSLLSPVHYVINRGRKCSAVEKVVERRQRRMIKNRESAARSRARKQAYTIELEEELKRLKELNTELQRKQAEFMEMQKNKNLDSAYLSRASKRQCLRRTLTGPW